MYRCFKNANATLGWAIPDCVLGRSRNGSSRTNTREGIFLSSKAAGKEGFKSPHFLSLTPVRQKEFRSIAFHWGVGGEVLSSVFQLSLCQKYVWMTAYVVIKHRGKLTFPITRTARNT